MTRVGKHGAPSQSINGEGPICDYPQDIWSGCYGWAAVMDVGRMQVGVCVHVRVKGYYAALPHQGASASTRYAVVAHQSWSLRIDALKGRDTALLHSEGAGKGKRRIPKGYSLGIL